jgi:NADP-dependent 3-hydroxy acid dehydrogenase YdfG
MRLSVGISLTVPSAPPTRVAVSLPGSAFPDVTRLWLRRASAANVSAMTTTDALESTQTTHRPLAGRVAVVTGATSGIGAATARRLAADGAAVAIAGRREERLADLAAELGDATDAGVVRVAVDVSNRGAVERAAASIRDELGRVDLVVANAGVMLAAPFEEADTAEWDRMLDTNVRGLLATGRAFADDLLAAAADGGRADLVHVGSIGGHEVFPNYGVYGATKAAVAHVTRNLRRELGPRGVRVKNVEPGLVRTELGEHMSDPGVRESLATWRDEIGALPPEDVADAIAFAVAAPPRVNVAELIVLPTVQG